MNIHFKEGDKVVCKPGYSGFDGDEDDPSYGGWGYESGLIFTIDRITNLSGRPVLWAKDASDYGVYADTVELLNEEERTYRGSRLVFNFL